MFRKLFAWIKRRRPVVSIGKDGEGNGGKGGNAVVIGSGVAIGGRGGDGSSGVGGRGGSAKVLGQ